MFCEKNICPTFMISRDICWFPCVIWPFFGTQVGFLKFTEIEFVEKGVIVDVNIHGL